jgi:hypothetical protein
MLTGRTTRITANLLLLAYVIVLFFLHFQTKTLFARPTPIHQWRQADCLSITKNYYEEGMHFFEPKIHFQGTPDGRAVSECPLLNYTVAGLWKIFGEHEFIYRLLEYMIFLTAMFFLLNTVLMLNGSVMLSLIVSGFVLTSPLLQYYGMNFLSDVPAFSFGVIALCLFLFFYFRQRQGYFYGALVLAVVAVLMKASALSALGIISVVTVISLLRREELTGIRPLFTRWWVPVAALAAAYGIIIAWYRFALAYNDNNSNNIFLLTVLPIWEMEEKELISNLRALFNTHFPVFLNRPMFFLFFLAVMYVISAFGRLHPVLKVSFILTFAFFILYLVFFFQVFGVHDYYLNNLMVFPVVTWLCVADLFSRNSFTVQNRSFVRSLLICLFIFNSFHSAAIYRLRTIEDDKLAVWYPFITQEERNLAKYIFWDYGTSIKRIEEFRPVLRKHGIKRTDFTLVIPDPSFDISLYFLDQKGYGIMRQHFQSDSLIMEHFRQKPIRYVVMSDTVLKRERAFITYSRWFQPFFKEGPVEVFKFRPR